MIYPIWRLSEDTPDNLGLACTDYGLVLGRTPLIEKSGACFVVRDRGEIARLLKYSYPGGLAVDRLMPGLATVAAALNANDPALARIAAVHLKIPDLPSLAARDALVAEDALIKYARDGGGDADWNPALHPRTGTPPNPGWFASTDGPQDEASHGESQVRFAANEDGSRSGAAPTSDAPITLPSDKPNDEPANFADRFGFSDRPATFNDRFGFGDQPANFNDRFGSNDRPGGNEFWSKIWPPIRAWLEEQVPEYDLEGGQVGERPRWRAIAPYVGIPIATAGIFGFEAYAPAIAAWLGLGSGAAEAGADAVIAGPRFIGSFDVPQGLKFGTTKFGDYAHQMIENMLKDRYRQATFIFRRTGVDVEVLDQEWIDTIGFRYGEIKPLTASGKSKFDQQTLNWDLSAPVQPITYDAAGNVFWGFH